MVGRKAPTLPWAGYNIFRLLAIVFMVWVLVAQFLCLTDDLQAYSNDKKALDPANGAALAGNTVNIAQPLPNGSRNDFDGFEEASKDLVRHRRRKHAGGSALMRDVYVGRSQVVKRDDEVASPDESEYWTGSEIPNQSGGVLFVVLSRIIIALVLILLISAQSGVPEMWLYEHVSWLGPQSTPLFLGFCQHLLAIENLHVYAKQTNLLPAWCLFGISGINILIGVILKLLARRLPKSPPPPLYFSHSVRLTYWIPPPAFYRQLFHPSTTTTQTGAQELPQSNSHTLGIDSDISSEDEEKAISRNLPRVIDGGGMMTVDQDVRKGGYPTFSGGNVSDVRRQVPLGVVEKGKHGDAIRFTRDDGGGAGMAFGVRNKVEARRSVLTPIVVPGRSGGETGKPVIQPRQLPMPSQVRPQSHLRPDHTVQPDSQTLLVPQVRPQPRSRGNAPLTPIGESEEPPTASKPLPSRNPGRKSSIEAASDLGPQFPMPPTRQSTVQAAARAKRESSAMSIVSSLNTTADTVPNVQDPDPRTVKVKDTKGVTRNLSTRSNKSIKPQFDIQPPESATLPPPSPARTPKSPQTLGRS